MRSNEEIRKRSYHTSTRIALIACLLFLTAPICTYATWDFSMTRCPNGSLAVSITVFDECNRVVEAIDCNCDGTVTTTTYSYSSGCTWVVPYDSNSHVNGTVSSPDSIRFVNGGLYSGHSFDAIGYRTSLTGVNPLWDLYDSSGATYITYFGSPFSIHIRNDGNPGKVIERHIYIGPQPVKPLLEHGSDQSSKNIEHRNPLLTNLGVSQQNGSVKVNFTLNEVANTSIVVYDEVDRLISTIDKGMLGRGDHVVTIPVQPGVNGTYFVSVQSGSDIATQQIVVAR